MVLTTLGISHHSAPIAIREQGVLTRHDYATRLQQLQATGWVKEALLLSTCNRTELYCTTQSIEPLKAWFSQLFHANDVAQIEPYLYTHQETHAIQHAMRLATGLDSMVLGEQQILGQLKEAYRIAAQAGTLGSQLHPLFQYVFCASKQIRNRSAIGAYPISIAFVAVNLAKKIFSDLPSARVAIIGTGQTSELVGYYLRDKGVQSISVFSRTLARATRLATAWQGRAETLDNLALQLPQMDIVISATSSALPIIGKGSVEQAIKLRKHRPILMIDLASPRDIETQVKSLQDVYLYDLDDLQAVIEESLSKRSQAAGCAQALIDAHVSYYQKRLQSLQAFDLIKQFRAELTSATETCLEKAYQRLQQGELPAMVLAGFASSLTQQFAHHPTLFMREAAENSDLQALELCRQALGLSLPEDG